jgi:hypothetical protein
LLGFGVVNIRRSTASVRSSSFEAVMLPTSLKPFPPPILPPFESSLIKLRRARRHIAELQDMVDAYLGRRPVYQILQPDLTNPPMINVQLVVREVLPNEASAIMGDAIHNMRVSLDLLANDLARLAGKPTENVYFPFAKTREEVETMIVKRKLSGIAREALHLIQQLEPFTGGNLKLRAIHDLDVTDKHQNLLPAFFSVDVGPLDLL